MCLFSRHLHTYTAVVPKTTLARVFDSFSIKLLHKHAAVILTEDFVNQFHRFLDEGRQCFVSLVLIGIKKYCKRAFQQMIVDFQTTLTTYLLILCVLETNIQDNCKQHFYFSIGRIHTEHLWVNNTFNVLISAQNPFFSLSLKVTVIPCVPVKYMYFALDCALLIYPSHCLKK